MPDATCGFPVWQIIHSSTRPSPHVNNDAWESESVADMSDALTFIDTNLGRFREELNEFLRIPSISAKSEHDHETSRAAHWLAAREHAGRL